MLSPASHSAADVIRLFALEPLPSEGGWFRRVAESHTEILAHSGVSNGRAPLGMPNRQTPRRAWSSIHALFTPDGFSALHRLTSDEIWLFHAGDPLESLRLYPDAGGERITLGLDPAAGERAHDVVRAGTWQGTRLQSGGRWAFVSCIVVPEFDWSDFQLATRGELTGRFPAWTKEIQALTRGVESA
jgi:predicted cupin superfamily sugar epimerase